MSIEVPDDQDTQKKVTENSDIKSIKVPSEIFLDTIPKGVEPKTIEDLRGAQIRDFLEARINGGAQNIDLSEINNFVDDALLEWISQKSLAITGLNLSYCHKVTDVGLGHLSKMVGITNLNLEGCYQITDAGLKHLATLINMETLNLKLDNIDENGSENITDVGLASLAGMTKMKALNLGNLVAITSGGISYLKNMTQMEVLSLAGCYGVDDDALAYLKNMSRMLKLGLSGCDSITNDGLNYLSGMPAMRSLDIGELRGVTDAGLASLSVMREMRDLNLFGCDNVTDVGLKQLVQLMTHLENFNFKDCAKVTLNSFGDLKNAMRPSVSPRSPVAKIGFDEQSNDNHSI